MTRLPRNAALVAVGTLTALLLPVGNPDGGFVATARAAIAAYSNPTNAVAAGYRPQPTFSTIVHYLNPAYEAPRRLDPNRPAGLVYRRDKTGEHLLGGFFLRTSATAIPPTLANLTSSGWHRHTECVGPTRVGPADTGAPCPPGTTPLAAPAMLHVWLNNVSVPPFTASLPTSTYECGVA